jgi:uncharacterized protein involved in exopolysaccharide biosynthesis
MNDYDEKDAPDEGGGAMEGILTSMPAILWQRRWLVILPFVITAAAALAAAFLLPASYRSEGTLLVESSQLATDRAGQVAAEVIDERIARVKQQVLSRPDLIAIIQELQLYPEQRARKSLSDIVEEMRKDISIEPVSAKIQDRSGTAMQTIAFSMSFDYSDPNIAQAVAQKLVERTLEVDSTRTAEQSSDAVRFLTEQTNTIRSRMDTIESQLSGMKARYGQVLASPSFGGYGSSGSLDAQIAMLERENSQLKAQRTSAQASAPRDPIVQAAEASLAAARATYSDNHPDVLIAKQRLAEAKELAQRNIANLPFDTLASQIETNNGQLAILRAARARESAQASAALSAQARAPLIQQQASQLQQQLDGLNEQYQDSAKKLAAAQTGQRVESEQRGERLTLVDPPVVTKEPHWPNRWLIIGGGIAGGLALGVLMAFAFELIKAPVRGPTSAAAAAGGGPLLGAIPVLKFTHPDSKSKRQLFWRRAKKPTESA